jgi:hypothetical protein
MKMTNKEQLIQEIEQAPDNLVEEVLNFLLFIKQRLQQKISETKNSENNQSSKNGSLLEFLDNLSSTVPQEEWEKLPSDLSKNIDHYLYGAPKVEDEKE